MVSAGENMSRVIIRWGPESQNQGRGAEPQSRPGQGLPLKGWSMEEFSALSIRAKRSRKHSRKTYNISI